ncbi:unnamed protein product [Aphanomyces euteiches]|uniref:Uncharacterized protein n=1 Tax=Aphanomyces euteiches TaxID=100861 RepID=A0A6G0XD52_9STRA|nr:hypothetical protein Ae201684_006055 [Aphanomyces euteiches]KAH9069110.1 hypothetical protein Ae201684P_004804 [Aphanomyces euteiches]KAH9102055.1 hypothetical protein LEN26_015593 [Aphanomyces euteiches]KAH9124533.1 hypothetical protein AeMF1_004726 [Aphanomyces euteiches]KAH9156315.1 hypothetical protein AeRB84_001777 [Aphanomyces euteiches]
MHDISSNPRCCHCKNRQRPKLPPKKTWKRMAHAEQVKLKQRQARAAIQSLEATKEALLTRRELKRSVRWNWFVIFSMEDGELLQRWAEEAAEWSCMSDDNRSHALLQLREHSEQAGHDVLWSFCL